MITTFILFKDSKNSFLSELDRNSIEYSQIELFSSGVMASGELIAIAKAFVSSTAFATVVVTWLKTRASRKIIVTAKDEKIIHLEGYSVDEVEKILAIADRVAVVETGGDKDQ
ncbi:hypothetical protein SB461_27420 [Burkholderia cenocepacia]|uniref:effector-associated constant component EACC1 n=1 Tax=Burkholderia cenocepacia TaxID=95486 RepID=UPI002864574B|nr:hypothetical protein [Burkholderia cenocepacia]MDR5665270.1 hypothetical protein [Burkholderia cenocepacia]MDR5668283.1 hypothetical protein [Burkholderia cenocepacia]MDR8097031.1 hypothetical protein [Burkholderia cenocepacia]MEB2610231.1 hypothetical protein [Burkholderia cenocepacia]HDR9797398.1 hypothetical protein [Burkholderia cenocepacia]